MVDGVQLAAAIVTVTIVYRAVLYQHYRCVLSTVSDNPDVVTFFSVRATCGLYASSNLDLISAN